MDWYLLALAGAALLVLVSLLQRARYLRMARGQELVEPVDSPLSEAVKQLVGVAGGVYVALVSLAAFLRLPVQETVQVFGLTFDPLALAALVVAIVQPFFYPRVGRRR